jgi:lipid-binding SYLF domain-containing protein
MPTPAETRIRAEIATERAELARTLEDLRAEVDVTKKLGRKLPVVVVGALGAGFVLGGGIGSTMRLLMRRSREGDEKARVGRFSLAKRG